MKPTQEQVKELFEYDPRNGVFTWKARTCQRNMVGKIAGTLNTFGHRQIRVDGTLRMAHHLAWLYITGEWPPENIDHVNGNPDDNRISNLRLATPKQNQENVKLRCDNSSGHKGVYWNKRERKWVARVQHHKTRIFVGRFDSLTDAVNAVKLTRDDVYTHHRTEYAS